MYEQVEKPKENKSRAVANESAQQQISSELTFQFEDNRPETVTQRKLQGIASNNIVVQRAILKTDNTASSLIQTYNALVRDIIMTVYTEDQNDQALDKIGKFLEKDSVKAALNDLREGDPAYNLSAIIAKIRARLNGNVNNQTAQVLANSLARDQVNNAVLTEDDRDLLAGNMKLSGYITTDAEKAEIRRRELERQEIDGFKMRYGAYATIFDHIFKGDFNGQTPTGYHSEVRPSNTHETYGSTTNLGHNTYQKSVQSINDHRKKPLQSTFFPANASEDDVKLAVVSGDNQHNNEVKYPETMRGMPLLRKGGTIFPNTGQDKNAE